jgi:hypothetical protein
MLEWEQRTLYETLARRIVASVLCTRVVAHDAQYDCATAYLASRFVTLILVSRKPNFTRLFGLLLPAGL